MQEFALFLQTLNSRSYSYVVKHEFEILLTFLDRFRPEVEGRTETVLEDELKEKLERFSAGICSEEERNALCQVLRDRPDLVRWVADRVKSRRRVEPAI